MSTYAGQVHHPADQTSGGGRDRDSGASFMGLRLIRPDGGPALRRCGPPFFVKEPPPNADPATMAMGITDGARLMRASFDVVRRRPSLLWFPVISTASLALTAGYWI